MANKKISQLNDGTNLGGTDELVINRGGTNYKITGTYIQTFTNAPLTASIATNTTNIAANTAAIATNATAIGTNTTNIATNTSNITTNTGNITTNATNIAANTTSINTNTTNIATNTAAIAALYRIIRVTSQAEFEAAASDLAATGGAIVIDGSFNVLSNFSVNLTDIQVWGMNGTMTFFNNSTNAKTKMTITGSNFFFREVRFAGCADFKDDGLGVPNSGPYSGWGTSYTKTIIELNSGTLSRGQFVDCNWYDCIAKENAGTDDEPIVMVTNMSNWATLKFERNDVATRHSSGTAKVYGGFRLGRADTYQGWRVIFLDWSLAGSAGIIGTSPYSNNWADSFSYATRFYITEATNGTIQREFITDGSIIFDISRSTVGAGAMSSTTAWNVFQPRNQSYHFTGTVVPSSVATYGKPGDTYRDTGTGKIYIKHTTIKKDTNWTVLN